MRKERQFEVKPIFVQLTDNQKETVNSFLSGNIVLLK